MAPGSVEWAILGEDSGVALPTCEAVACNDISIPNSNFVYAGQTTGDTVSVQCASGYHLSTGVFSFDISCDGAPSCTSEWSGIQSCVPVQCEQLFVGFSEFSDGEDTGLDTVSDPLYVTCAAGYEPDGDGPCDEVEIFILTDTWCGEISWEIEDSHGNIVGSWDGNDGCTSSSPETETFCLTLATELYKFTVYDSFGDGIWTPGGYRVSVNNVVVEEDFTVVPGSTLAPVEVPLGTQACSVERTCSPNGPGLAHWTGDTQCVRKQCDAFAVEGGEGGSYVETVSGDGIQTVVFTCRDGFATSTGGGSFTATCTAFGPCDVDWIGVDSCQCVECTDLSVANGETCDEVEIFILTDIWCEEISWEIEDSIGNIVGSWDGSDGCTDSSPETETFCLPIATELYTFTVYDSFGDGIWTPGGYRVSVNNVVVEEDFTDSWSLSYTVPLVSSAGTCAEQSVTVTCSAGYCAGGDGVFDVECLGTAPAAVSWGPVETCEPVTCEDAIIAHGSYSGSYVTGEGAIVTCDDGYRVAGSSHDYQFTMDCQAASVCVSDWNDYGYTCEPVPCETLVIENAGTFDTGSDSTSPPDYFTCADGFEPSTPDADCQVERTCVPNGPGYAMWSGTSTCERVVCPAPTGDHYGTAVQEILEDEQVLTQYCEAGYGTDAPSGSFVAVCVPDGACAREWNNLPACECVDCVDRTFAYSNYHFEEAQACTTDSQVVNCDDGYCSSDTQTDTFTITCGPVSPGAVEWEDLQTCEPVSCGDISFINSDQSEVTSGVTGDEFEVNCYDGYASGDCTAWMVQCVATGPCQSEWTHSDLECQEEGYVEPIVEPIIGDCNPPNTNAYLLEDSDEAVEAEPVLVPIELTCSGTISSDYNPITEVCINIEHSYVNDIRMILYCPDNLRSVTLMSGRDVDTGAYFGNVCDDANQQNCAPGEHGGDGTGADAGWDYCFANDATYSIWNAPPSCSGSCMGPNVPGSCCFPENGQIPSGTYQSMEHFEHFEGCSIAGTWTLEILDQRHLDDGWLYSVTIGLEDNEPLLEDN
jgi:hypothetical protein